ncbi:hypothetical protein PVAND_006216 [Polypedilum vanderplanki]|uniref:UDENN FNIP1/2-type domain-containing protein n=1 Tax=Polypedilum vanderplanki TaxID=319348 RepID=A0A9J6C2X8_POLVA|nr:hypothetical protein PVAND_006216 [Polypedilum vanderplanki]
MALFNKLFNKRKLVKQSSNQSSSSQFPFNKEQVRILLFRECDWRGRRLLFDSSGIEAVTTTQAAATATTPGNSLSPQCQQQQQCTATNSVQKKSSPLKPDKSTIEYFEGKPYKYGRPTQDVNQIAEMVFGSVAISFRGTSFKVHWLQTPARALCSQVFLAPVQPYSSTSSSSTNTHSSSGIQTHSSNYGSDMISLSGSMSESNSLNSFSASESLHNGVTRSTNPLDVPTALSLDNDDFKFISQSIGDSSGYNSSELWTQLRHNNPYSSARSSLASIYSDIENHSRKMSISSSVSEYPSCEFGHLNRRIMKNLSTSFENVSTITENMSNIVENNYYTVSGAIGLSDGCVSKLRRNSEIVVDARRKTTSGDALSSNSSTLHHSHNRAYTKRPRLAVAVCINMSECVEQEMLMFCSEHMALLEQMIYRLRAAAENAYINRQNFLQLMIKCWHITAQWLVDLFSAPRLTLPVWLSLSTGVKNSNTLACSFMQDLCQLLNTADTKDTNFFISTLLTAVLTHHLGWISTVKFITSNIKESLNKNGSSHITKLIEEENLKLSEISKIFPYNSLWAQLGDLYGAITNPIKLSKTIICGNEAHVKTIEKILNVLTYFIRCSEIRRNTHTKVFDKDELNKIVNQQLNQRKTVRNLKVGANAEVHATFKGLRKSGASGLTRTSTTVKELNKVLQEQESNNTSVDDFSDLDPETYRLLMNILKKNVMNDIPKVLAFRDSRFVKQELRIGNASMDTGIEMSAKDRQYLSSNYQKVTGDHIKLTVTRPDNDGIEETIEFDDDGELQNQLANFISLSNLITENSLGGAQMKMKMFWEKNQCNEALNLEQIKHLERIQAKHQMQEENEKLKSIPEKLEETESHVSEIGSSSGVVFVLGDNEQLIGLRSSPSIQTISCTDDGVYPSTSTAAIGAIKKSCKHKKKHSGVKFNFEKYPQIATNYMKSKNLEFSELEVLEKGLRMEKEESCSSQLKSNFSSNLTLQSQDSSDSDDECECCRNGGEASSYLQTPSNATELEFSSDQSHDSIYVPSSSSKETLNDSFLKTLDENRELKSVDDIRVIEIPMLDSIKKQSVQDEILKPGFTSSLFTSTTDHYISDMILQGITAPPLKWELQLKNDLSISSHCGVLEQSQAENIAIVANIDKWDVRLISSHSNALPSHNTVTGIIGMSQLVGNMLECVQAMFNSGISEFQCLSFIESKLREMYIHSETLATFLMDTEFCSLNTLTTTLGLSINDIPLLMSIASIHSPQITKKYGISFR